MQRKYNYIYSQLVKEDADLIGHIAYSLYKKQKIEYIQKQQTNGKELTDEELVPFNDFSSSESSIDSYKIKAEIIVQGFIENVLDETFDDMEKQAVSRQSEILKTIVDPLKPSYLKDLGIGVLSAFIFALLVIVLAFYIQNKDTSFNITVETPKTTTAPAK